MSSLAGFATAAAGDESTGEDGSSSREEIRMALAVREEKGRMGKERRQVLQSLIKRLDVPKNRGGYQPAQNHNKIISPPVNTTQSST